MRVRSVICTVALVLAATTVGSPAQAATRSVDDRAGDVGHAMDIRRVTIRNGDRLVITIKHRAVTERNGSWSGAYIDVTPGSQAAPNYYIAGGVGTHFDLYWMNGWRIGGRLGCPGPGGYRHSYNFKLDITRFTLARSCLNGASFKATRVRVAAIAGVSGRRMDWAPGYRRYSPWVARG